jgi:hypothetical protein
MWTFANSPVEFREPNFVPLFLHSMHRRLFWGTSQKSTSGLDSSRLRSRDSSNFLGLLRLPAINPQSADHVRTVSLPSQKSTRFSPMAVFPGGVVARQPPGDFGQESESTSKACLYRKSPQRSGIQPLFHHPPQGLTQSRWHTSQRRVSSRSHVGSRTGPRPLRCRRGWSPT